ncbi:MAG: hypothetical protein ABTQ32_01310 [Myxococcaceae bacterium]
MPLDIHHHRRADLDWSELITCPHCGHRARGRVAVSGVGEGTAHGGLFNEDAHQRAGIDAFDKASSQGASLLRRAKCPACGKRGQGSLGSFMTAAGLGLSMAVLGYRQLEEAAIVLGVVMVLPLGALFAWWHTNKADSAVSWESVADLAPAARPISPGWAAQQAPPKPVQAPPNLEPPGESSGLELDFDRSWNKKKS